MLISSVVELKMYLPAYAGEHISQMAGFIDNSEHDFLLPYIGKPLYNKVAEAYGEMEDHDVLLEPSGTLEPMQLLITLCQRCAAFDAYRRAIDVNAVSVHDSGVNMLTAGEYDSAGQQSIKAFKDACLREAHAAVNRLLLQLEEWAIEVAALPANNDGEETDVRAEIIALWRESRYYTLADGLLINTATEYQNYVDIYDSRERFVELMPDLRYVQEIWLRMEVGSTLMDSLLASKRSGFANDEEETKTYRRQVVAYLTAALAFGVEGRAKMFETRKGRQALARDESRQLLGEAKSVMDAHPEAFEGWKQLVQGGSSQGGETALNGSSSALATSENPKWENNKDGNALFVMPGMFR